MRAELWEAAQAMFPGAGSVVIRVRHPGGSITVEVPNGSQFRVICVMLFIINDSNFQQDMH